MKRWILISFVAAVFAIVGYYATLPVPDELPNPYWMRTMTALIHVMRFILPTRVAKALQGLQPPITPLPGFNITEATADGIPVIFYQPLVHDSRPLPAVIYIHGGGWIVGNIYQSHGQVSNMATSLGNSVFISVGYRLAPMHTFPAAIDDVTKATVWLLRHSDQLNIDSKRVVIMGESAGGNLAAAASQRLTFDSQYKTLPKLRAQVLICSPLQMFDFQTPSYQQNGRYYALVVDKYWLAQMWNNYLAGDEALVPKMLANEHTSAVAKRSMYSRLVSHDLIPKKFKMKNYSPPQLNMGNEHVYNKFREIMLNPDFAPLMRPVLSGLPEALILTAEFDNLRDDGILYAKRLEADGVRTSWKHYDRAHHMQFPSVLSQPPSANGKYDDIMITDIFDFLEETFK